MRVFRCITAREIKSVYQGETNELAPCKGQNTHNYNKDEHYIHFFRYSNACEYYFNYSFFSMCPEDKYVLYMVANIPNEVLEKYKGFGFYTANQDCFSDIHGYSVILPEYAIPISEFKPEYIVTIAPYISHEYKNDEEYYKYEKATLHLIKKYKHNINKVVDFYKKNTLQDVLKVKDDNRTEHEIMNERIKTLSKVLADLG